MRIAETDERCHEIIYGTVKKMKVVQILQPAEQVYRYRLEYIKDETSGISSWWSISTRLKGPEACAMSTRRRSRLRSRSRIRRSPS